VNDEGNIGSGGDLSATATSPIIVASKGDVPTMSFSDDLMSATTTIDEDSTLPLTEFKVSSPTINESDMNYFVVVQL
jgi:hypothetical protein